MKKIRADCGGWLENEEETELKIICDGLESEFDDQKKDTVENRDRRLWFSIYLADMVWCGTPVTYRSAMEAETSDWGDSQATTEIVADNYTPTIDGVLHWKGLKKK